MNLTNPIDSYIQTHCQPILDELVRLCAQPSISAQGVGMAETVGVLSEMLRRRGLNVEVIQTAGYPVVYAEGGKASGKTLLFYNHYDVQPPEPLAAWVTPPFEPSVRDGKLFARGVMDDKGHILCRLAAIDALLAAHGELPCRIKFLIEGEEEISSPNLAGFIESHAEKLKADACLWEFGEVDFDGTPLHYCGLRGILYVELSVQTASMDAHSGVTGGIFPNSAWRLLWALNSLKDPQERILIPGFYDAVQPPTPRDLELLAQMPDSARQMRETFQVAKFIKGLEGGADLQREAAFTPTCTVCGLTAGYQGQGQKTIVPARASAKVDFRLVPDQQPEDILAKLRAHLDRQGFEDIQITVFGREYPGRTDPDHPFVQMVARTAGEVYLQPPRIVPLSGGSGPTYHFTHGLGVPVTTVGVGYPGSAIHAPNEHIRLEDFYNAVRHTARVMEKLDLEKF